MGERRAGSGRRGVGPTDLQIRCAVNGRMETAKELVEKVLKKNPRVRMYSNKIICVRHPDRRNSVKITIARFQKSRKP